MKKWVVSIVLIFALVFILFRSLSVPGRVSFNQGIHAGSPAIYRVLSSQKFWSEQKLDFTINKKLYNSLELKGTINNRPVNLTILLIPVKNDSTTLNYNASFASSNESGNPLSKILSNRSLHTDISKAADKLSPLLSDMKILYGMNIRQTSTVDTFLVSTKFSQAGIPTLESIYKKINFLKDKVTAAGARTSGPPMLNISTTDSIDYRCMIALPVDRKLDFQNNAEVNFIRMIPGRFMAAEITGGPARIQTAHKMMDLYFSEYQKTSMAIPFDYLVTDRIAEQDTSKWVTRLYAPVF